ncbi:hypothetical protein D9V32_13425 [Mycetocola tolaasinivorans]|uniref:Uncharacterized protein n=1 Tax=Mycetocola tolaasinivorans TaxID=76635 RepID=A0A3L7A209_9MICO|nr:hypothetical protein D9V32_13425 [Mycetocola tolaasinivorans]
MQALTLGEIALWAVAVAAALTGLRKVWPSVKAFGVFVSALSELPQFMADTRAHAATTTATLAAVKHEVLPNHGGSLRDVVDRGEAVTGGIVSDVAELKAEVKTLSEKLGKDHTRLAVLEERTQPRDAQGRFTKGE